MLAWLLWQLYLFNFDILYRLYIYYGQSITLKRADFAEKASLERKGSTIFRHAYSGLTSSYALSAWLSNASLMHLDLVDIAKAFARAKFAEKASFEKKRSTILATPTSTNLLRLVCCSVQSEN